MVWRTATFLFRGRIGMKMLSLSRITWYSSKQSHGKYLQCFVPILPSVSWCYFHSLLLVSFCSKKVLQPYNCFFLVRNILARHEILMNTIGTHLEENVSYEIAATINSAMIYSFLALSFFELIFFLIYNSLVSIN